MKKLFLGLALALFAISATASATSISDSQTVSFDSAGVEEAQTIALDAFNSLGGIRILDSIVITVTHTASIDVGADNDNTGEATVTAVLNTSWTITGDGNVSSGGMKSIPGTPIELDGDDGDGTGSFSTLGGDYAVIEGLGYPLELAASITINPVDYSQFVDTGSVEYVITPLTLGVLFNGVASGLQMEIYDANLSVTTQITYNYHTESDVPEPAGAALFALAAVGVLFMRKRSV